MTMDPQAITRLLIETLASNFRITKPITGKTVIIEDLALDSLTVMNLVMEIEDRLDVSVPLDRLADIRTIDDLARCLAEEAAHR